MNPYRITCTITALVALFAACAENPTLPPEAAALTPLAGGDQREAVGELLPEPLTVRVTDERGRPLGGVSVSWALTDGATEVGSIVPSNVATDAEGRASARWTLSASLGTQRAVARVGTGDALLEAVFTADAQPGAPHLVSLSPRAAYLEPGEEQALAVFVQDRFGYTTTATLVWESSDTGVADVSADGELTGRATGQAIVRVRTGEVSDSIAVHVLPRLQAASVYAGDHTCALTAAGEAYCWGGNTQGEVGAGTTEPRPVATQVATALRFRSLAVGSRLTCGVADDGRAYCWGANDHGQLGNGTTDAAATPQAVSGGLVFAEVSAAAGYACGITAQGQAYCWGSNERGQLGTPGAPSSSVPVAVPGDHSFVRISAGARNACALTSAGAAYCWGDSQLGQLGSGADVPGTGSAEGVPAGPTAVAGGHVFRSLSVGQSFTCGATDGGVVLCWGNNSDGAVGETSLALQPRVVSGADGAVSVRAGARHACAMDAAGKLACWGSNWYGQLGTGSNSPLASATPLQASVASGTAIASGAFHNCTVDASGTIRCWGGGSLTDASEVFGNPAGARACASRGYPANACRFEARPVLRSLDD